VKSRKAKNENRPILPPPVNKRAEFTPFLKAKDIPKRGITPVTLLGIMRKSNTKYGEGVEVACRVGGKNYTFTVKRDSGNHSRLYERFGAENWNGIVKVERKKYMDNEYVAIVDSPIKKRP
jgi:hypothetical protein